MNFKRLILVAAAGLSLTSPAFANVITYSHSTGTATGTTPYSESFTLGKFDTRLGTLTDILITMSFNVTGSVSVQNLTTAEQQFTNASSWLPITLTGPGATSISTNAGTQAISNKVGAAVIAYVSPYGWMMAPGSFTQAGVTGTPSSSTYLPTASFSAYEGVGSTPLSFAYSAGNGVYGGSSVSGVYFGGTASANGNISIIYTYTPATSSDAVVPEPATLALLGLSLGLASVRRRRKV